MKLDTKNYKGTRDIYPEDMRLRQYIFNIWREVCESFGYERYDAPILEPLEIYAAKSGQEIVSEQTYAFTDRGDRKVAIRPEMTPSIARMVAAKRQEIPLPARFYSIANFMRYERPQKGREREFWQLNVDIFGVASVDADIEIISISDAILRRLGAKPEMYSILINDRRLTNYIMSEYLGLNETQSSAMIKLFDRRSKMSPEDFNDQAEEIFNTANVSDGLGKVDELIKAKKIEELPQAIIDNGPVAELQQLLTTLSKRGISNANYDATLMRGFDYYTGIVFEVFDNSPDNNRSMFGGGRYDGLVGLFGVEDLPVVGVAPGETTTIEFLKAWNLIPELKPTTDIYLISLNVDVEVIAEKLRADGMNIAIDISGRKLDKSIRAAERMGINQIMIIGENEIKSGNYKIKDLRTGTETTITV